ncbi:MAG TPA: type IV secretion system DNA-binding domain-containing protein [Steroidobacteraceae bacterium]|nr:type IV secretion system DNA-binding domain-containing protein [Steroidobacteraceae bacterium]
MNLHGWPGLLAAYASVEAPMLAALGAARAPLGRAAAALAAGVPLTVLAGTALSLAGPLTHALGLGTGSAAGLAGAVGLSGAMGWGCGRMLAGRRAAAPATYERGALVEEQPAAATTQRARTHRRQRALTLGGIAVPEADETKHFKLIGTTGTGKSTAIHELLGAALARGDRAVIADPDGGYLRRFYDGRRGDRILNPFDPRSARWDLFGEIDDPYDVEQLARSLIPDHEGADRSWRGYARTFFSAVTSQAHLAGSRDVRELYRLLVVAGTPELKTLVAGTPAQPFLEDNNGRMFDSIRSVTSSAVGALDYVARQRSAPLAVRHWVRDAGAAQGGVLFLPYRAGQIAALRSTVSAWMRLAIFETMNREEVAPAEHRRLWFVVDELDALGQIDGLKDALARLRKFGGRCVLGFQSVAQVSSTYGHGEATTLVENCGNSLILRCSGSEHGGTSQFASRLIGEREVRRLQRSRSRAPGALWPSHAESEHHATEPAVMPAQIEQLPDLAGYLKLASDPRWRRVQVPLPAAARAHDPVPAAHPEVSHASPGHEPG